MFDINSEKFLMFFSITIRDYKYKFGYISYIFYIIFTGNIRLIVGNDEGDSGGIWGRGSGRGRGRGVGIHEIVKK